MRTLPAAEAEQGLAKLESGELSSAACPHCGGVNFFPGFSAMLAYVCRHCGQGVKVENAVQ
jgi:hypothetical protein